MLITFIIKCLIYLWLEKDISQIKPRFIRYPRLLYKYYSADRADIFIGGEVRFSQFAALNDPLEFGVVLSEKSLIAASAKIERWITTIVQSIFIWGLPLLLIKKISKLDNFSSMSIYRKLFTIIYIIIYFQKRHHALKNLKENTDYKNALDKFRTEFPKIFLEGIYDKSILIFSCSEAKNNIPMWAHYAGNHTGFQICFDPSKAFEVYTPKGQLVKPSLEKVKYVKRFPKPKDPLRGLRIIAKTKLASWSYEEEWRFTAIPQNLRESGTDKAGLPIFLAPLNLLSIQEITFGHLASDDLISRVKIQCATNIPAVKFWKNNNRGSREPII